MPGVRPMPEAGCRYVIRGQNRAFGGAAATSAARRRTPCEDRRGGVDDRRFDALTRTFAVRSSSRRHAVRLLAGGAVGGLLARLGLQEAVAGCAGAKTGCTANDECATCAKTVCQEGTCCRPAGKPCTRSGHCCSGRCNTKKRVCRGCPAGTEPCGGRCVDAGTCGGCPTGQELCGTTCVDTQSDPSHCGGCDRPPCQTGQTCDRGVCVWPTCPPSTPDACWANGSRTCTNLQTDKRNCGWCGRGCAPEAAWMCCGGQCVYTGGCGPATTGSCFDGFCGGCTTCSGSLRCCDVGGAGTCVDLTTDPNCGLCGNDCGAQGMRCENGQCRW